jgi:hypothetical protein
MAALKFLKDGYIIIYYYTQIYYGKNGVKKYLIGKAKDKNSFDKKHYSEPVFPAYQYRMQEVRWPSRFCEVSTIQ